MDGVPPAEKCWQQGRGKGSKNSEKCADIIYEYSLSATRGLWQKVGRATVDSCGER